MAGPNCTVTTAFMQYEVPFHPMQFVLTTSKFANGYEMDATSTGLISKILGGDFFATFRLDDNQQLVETIN